MGKNCNKMQEDKSISLKKYEMRCDVCVFMGNNMRSDEVAVLWMERRVEGEMVGSVYLRTDLCVLDDGLPPA